MKELGSPGDGGLHEVLQDHFALLGGESVARAPGTDRIGGKEDEAQRERHQSDHLVEHNYSRSKKKRSWAST